MGTAERREREKAELRQKILEVAREMFVEQGAEAVTMRKLAERIEYSPTAIYAHFPDKDALLLALCENDFAALFGHVVHLFQVADPVERIVSACHLYVDWALEHQHQYKFMFMTAGFERMQPSDPSLLVYAGARDALKEVIAAGRFRSRCSEPGVLLTALWSTLHGIVSLEIVGHLDMMRNHPRLHEPDEDLSNKHLAHVAVDAMLSGFLKEVPPVTAVRTRPTSNSQQRRTRSAAKRRKAS